MVATAAAAVLLVLATAAALAHIVPTLAGLVPRRARHAAEPTHRFAILVPAHNEETTLPATLDSLARLDYPQELVRVYVIADNCTDGTVAVAWAAGAVCMVRVDPTHRGKGHALAFGLTRVLKDTPDVVVVLDADCELNADALRALDTRFAAGAAVVQCAVRSRNADDGASGYVAAVGAVVDEVIARGHDRLGGSVPLRGTGMALRRGVLTQVPWAAFGATEDAEYARQLRDAGIGVKHCCGAVVSCQAPARIDDLCRQRRRWSAAGTLASKPLALWLLAVAATAGFATGFMWWPVSLIVATAAVYLRAAVAIGVTRHRVGLMLRSPAVVVRLGWLALAAARKPAPVTWDRTARPVATGRRAA